MDPFIVVFIRYDFYHRDKFQFVSFFYNFFFIKFTPSVIRRIIWTAKILIHKCQSLQQVLPFSLFSPLLIFLISSFFKSLHLGRYHWLSWTFLQFLLKFQCSGVLCLSLQCYLIFARLRNGQYKVQFPHWIFITALLPNYFVYYFLVGFICHFTIFF